MTREAGKKRKKKPENEKSIIPYFQLYPRRRNRHNAYLLCLRLSSGLSPFLSLCSSYSDSFRYLQQRKQIDKQNSCSVLCKWLRFYLFVLLEYQIQILAFPFADYESLDKLEKIFEFSSKPAENGSVVSIETPDVAKYPDLCYINNW